MGIGDSGGRYAQLVLKWVGKRVRGRQREGCEGEERIGGPGVARGPYEFPDLQKGLAILASNYCTVSNMIKIKIMIIIMIY